MIDVSDLVTKLSNTVQYTYGYIYALESEKREYMLTLGAAVVRMLYAYIDSKARINGDELAHVYEPNMAGDPEGRLFSFKMGATSEDITINSRFYESKGMPNNGDRPFKKRATVMEEGAPITITPKGNGVLVFDYKGERVVTRGPVYVAEPGGPEAAGGFQNAVEDFFTSYIKPAMLNQSLRALATPLAYHSNFAVGAKMGRNAGIRAGKKEMERAKNELK